MWYDADIDAVMTRTAMRPIPRGRIARGEALVSGLSLRRAVWFCALATNLVAAGLLAFTILFYVVVYTAWLKRHAAEHRHRRRRRRTAAGDRLGRGHRRIGLEPLVLFLIVFLWTPPHFWALALNRSDEYARAGVPMLPVVAGRAATKRQILIYSLLLVRLRCCPGYWVCRCALWRDRRHLGGALHRARVAAQQEREGDRRAATAVRVFHRLSVRAVCGSLAGHGGLMLAHALVTWGRRPDACRAAAGAVPATPAPSTQMRSDMRHGLLAIVLIGAAALGGCSEGVLDPKGPDRRRRTAILFNSLGIMLAIVIPTILATLGVAFWFRSSNRRARYLPDFTYSGRLELLVWSIPAMTVLLVGGVAWIGAHDLDPRKPIASAVKPLKFRSSRSIGNGCSSTPTRHRERQPPDRSGRPAGQLRVDLLGRDEQLLRAAARRPDLHHGGNDDAPSPAGRPFGHIPGLSASSAATVLPTCASP